MALPNVDHSEAGWLPRRMLCCGAAGAATMVVLGLAAAGLSGWAAVLMALPGIGALAWIGWWSVQDRSPAAPATADDHTGLESVWTGARRGRRTHVSLLFGETLDRTLRVDGLAQTRASRPTSPWTPFSLVVLRPGTALADQLLVHFVSEYCESGQELEVVTNGSSRRVVLCTEDSDLVVELAEPARFA